MAAGGGAAGGACAEHFLVCPRDCSGSAACPPPARPPARVCTQSVGVLAAACQSVSGQRQPTRAPA